MIEVNPTLKDGACKCGANTFMLAEDQTIYTDWAFTNGAWESGSSNSEDAEADQSVRFFCTVCGEYYFPPTEVVKD